MADRLEGITERWTTSPWGFREMDLPTYLRTMQALGVTRVCMMISSQLLMGVSQYPGKSEIVNVRALIERHGLEVVELCGSFDLTVAEGVEAEIGKALIGLDTAKRLGASLYRVFAGWIREDRASEATHAQIAEGLSIIAGRAERTGLTVVLENHGGVTRTAEQVKRILDAVPSTALGLNYDPANFMIHGEDPLAALDLLKDRIAFTHLKSTRVGVSGKREYCRVRGGEIDYAPIFARLLPDYQGIFGLEYEEPADAVCGTRDDFRALREAMGKTL